MMRHHLNSDIPQWRYDRLALFYVFFKSPMGRFRFESWMQFVHIFIFMSIIPFLPACTGGEDFSKKLSFELSKGAGTKIVFSELTHFPWDMVYVYGPYHPLEEVNKKHGTTLKGKYGFSHVPEGDCLYLFKYRGNAVKIFFYPRYKGGCEGILKPGVFTPETAVFEVDIKTIGSHPYLKWVRSNS